VTRRRLWIAAAIVIVSLVAVLGLGVVRSMAPPPPISAAPASSETGTVKFLMEQQWAIRMKLAKATPAAVARQITATGRVVPAPGRHVVVAPPVAGILTGITVPRVGQAVDRGQTLAVVRQTPTAAEAAQIASGQAQAQIEIVRLEAERRRLAEAVKEAEVRRNHAKVEFERAERLYEAKAYALRQVQAAEADYRSAESVLAATIAQRDAVAATRIPPPTGWATGASHVIQAPIAGTVVRVAKGLGEQVAAGEAVAEILDPTVVWIEVPVFERDLSHLGRQTRAFFTTPAAPGKEYTGRLIDAGAVVNRETRAVTAVFEVPNPDRGLRVGLQANVRLDAEERADVLMIPREAVLESEGKRFVYVLVSGEEFQRREVVVGDEYGDQVAILGGLKAGERVVTQGAYQLRQHELRPSSPGAHTHET
jgi:cobalt-zinc-cadmium efflux system membrane fusion protein